MPVPPGFLDFSTNDYLGLAGADIGIHFERFGSSGSRLLGGNSGAAMAFEAEFAQWIGRDRGLLFNSGYHANLGVIPAVVGPRDLVLVDRLAHASVLDGIRLSGAKWHRYRHNDTPHLKRLLDRYAHSHGTVLIVTESVFSMDGDVAPLADIVSVADEFGAAIMVDEAHALGVMGPEGRGVTAALGLQDRVDIWVGALGKAWGSMGAMVVGDETLIELLVSSARSFMYSTALPAPVVAWNHEMLRRMPLLTGERQALKGLYALLGAPSPIVPIVVGDTAQAISASKFLWEHGIVAPAIKPPTVPEGTSRLRLSLSATMTPSDIRRAMGTIEEWRNSQ